MTVRRFSEEINVPQWLATLIPIALMAIGAWVTVSSRIAVLEERLATHLSANIDARVMVLERETAVSNQAATEILRRLDKIDQRLAKIEQNGGPTRP